MEGLGRQPRKKEMPKQIPVAGALETDNEDYSALAENGLHTFIAIPTKGMKEGAVIHVHDTEKGGRLTAHIDGIETQSDDDPDSPVRLIKVRTLH